MSDFFIRISDEEAEAMLREMARQDMRTIAATTIILIREGWERRMKAQIVNEEQSQPEQATGSLSDAAGKSPAGGPSA